MGFLKTFFLTMYLDATFSNEMRCFGFDHHTVFDSIRSVTLKVYWHKPVGSITLKSDRTPIRTTKDKLIDKLKTLPVDAFKRTSILNSKHATLVYVPKSALTQSGYGSYQITGSKAYTIQQDGELHIQFSENNSALARNSKQETTQKKFE